MTRIELRQAIESLLREHFSMAEMLFFCYDSKQFQAEYAGLTERANNRTQLIAQLLERVDDRMLLPDFLAALQREVAARRTSQSQQATPSGGTVFNQQGQQVEKQSNIGHVEGGMTINF